MIFTLKELEEIRDDLKHNIDPAYAFAQIVSTKLDDIDRKSVHYYRHFELTFDIDSEILILVDMGIVI